MSRSSSFGVTDMIALAREEASVRGMLLEKYRGYMVVLAERSLDQFLTARVDAEDIVQNTMVRAEQAFDQFRGSTPEEFFQWLMAIHRNSLLEEFARQSAAKRDPAREIGQFGSEETAIVYWTEPADDEVTPSTRMIMDEEALRLSQALCHLTYEQREAVRLRHIEGWALSEIASRMGKSKDSVAGLIKRGLESLRVRMATD